jgi:hypothetical protein
MHFEISLKLSSGGRISVPQCLRRSTFFFLPSLATGHCSLVTRCWLPAPRPLAFTGRAVAVALLYCPS